MDDDDDDEQIGQHLIMENGNKAKKGSHTYTYTHTQTGYHCGQKILKKFNKLNYYWKLTKKSFFLSTCALCVCM